MNSSLFGPGFKWGVSASAFQTEGAALTDGKGLSIWDDFCMRKGKIHLNQTAEEACDFYNRFMHDLILLNFIGFKNFRFSLSWPRLFPKGTGEKNEKGFDFYDKLIDICLEMDIEPWITLYHWDLPLELELKGGWTNREIIHSFASYVEAVVEKYGDRVKNWMILNEPLVFTGAGYFLGIHAPGRKGLHNFLAAAHHATLCQAIGARIIKSVDGSHNVGTTYSAVDIHPLDHSNLNVEATQRMNALCNRLFIEPLVGMGYPVNDLKILQYMEKYMQQDDEKQMCFHMDFIGIQNYTREVVKYTPFIPYLSARIIQAKQRNVPSTTLGWEVYPEGIYNTLKQFSSYKDIQNIYITENGAAFNDLLIDGKVEDMERINYFNGYLQQVLKAKNEGIPVKGYFAWSLTDNFEWAEGFKHRFGLVYVDFKTQRRYIKASGHWFHRFLTEASQELLKTG